MEMLMVGMLVEPMFYYYLWFNLLYQSPICVSTKRIGPCTRSKDVVDIQSRYTGFGKLFGIKNDIV